MKEITMMKEQEITNASEEQSMRLQDIRDYNKRRN
jgi:hypothetical protein